MRRLVGDVEREPAEIALEFGARGDLERRVIDEHIGVLEQESHVIVGDR